MMHRFFTVVVPASSPLTTNFLCITKNLVSRGSDSRIGFSPIPIPAGKGAAGKAPSAVTISAARFRRSFARACVKVTITGHVVVDFCNKLHRQIVGIFLVVSTGSRPFGILFILNNCFSHNIVLPVALFNDPMCIGSNYWSSLLLASSAVVMLDTFSEADMLK